MSRQSKQVPPEEGGPGWWNQADTKDLQRPNNIVAEPSLPTLLHEDPLPPGPYRLALTRYGAGNTGRPYIVRAGDGRCICGWIDSRACAEAIVAALNAQFPA